MSKLNVDQKTIKDLLDGKTVKMPEFDFYSGEKKFKTEMTFLPSLLLFVSQPTQLFIVSGT